MDIKVLVVEDEVAINHILTSALIAEGYIVKSTFSSQEARNSFQKFTPHLALLDVNLPDESGFELCRFINTNYAIPIIMLTARNEIFDKVVGLELGADDYITKPFHIKEVLTRIKVALRRVEKYRTSTGNNFVKVNEIVKINLDRKIVMKDDQEVRLKPKEYELLAFFVTNKNRIFSREELLDKVWGYDFDGELRTVDVHVRRLRSKLDNDSTKSIIETIFGIGYVMR